MISITKAADAAAERMARATSTRYTRKSILGRVGRTAVIVAGGPAAYAAVTAAPAAAAYSPLCGGVCFGSCPSNTNPLAGCWWGCDSATSGCCAGGKQRKICDCMRACSPSCSSCGRLPAVYFVGPCQGECCTVCRRVTACGSTSC